MKLTLDITQSVQENASAYFEKAKRLKQKMKGAEEGLVLVREKLAHVETESQKIQSTSPLLRRKKEWFEKFHWCYTTNGLLLVGGRDAHSNESLIKRHMEEKDWYFHADVHGAPHCLLKEGKLSAKKEDMEQAASFAGVFSSVWKKGLFSVRVYAVSPEQVTKKAPSGESLGKGAFMIYGSREWFDPRLSMGVGVQDTPAGLRVMGGPLSCIQTHCRHLMEIVPGEKSKAEVAKSYARFLQGKGVESSSLLLDEIMGALPNGLLALKPVLN